MASTLAGGDPGLRSGARGATRRTDRLDGRDGDGRHPDDLAVFLTGDRTVDAQLEDGRRRPECQQRVEQAFGLPARIAAGDDGSLVVARQQYVHTRGEIGQYGARI